MCVAVEVAERLGDIDRVSVAQSLQVEDVAPQDLASADGAVRRDDGAHAGIALPALKLGNPQSQGAPLRDDGERRLRRIPHQQQAPFGNKCDAGVLCVAREVMERHRHQPQLNGGLAVEHSVRRDQPHLIPRDGLGRLLLSKRDRHVAGKARTSYSPSATSVNQMRLSRERVVIIASAPRGSRVTRAGKKRSGPMTFLQVESGPMRNESRPLLECTACTRL